MSEDDWPPSAQNGGGITATYLEKCSFPSPTPKEIEARRLAEEIMNTAYDEACNIMRAKYGGRIVREPCRARNKWIYSIPSYKLSYEGDLKNWEKELFGVWAGFVRRMLAYEKIGISYHVALTPKTDLKAASKRIRDDIGGDGSSSNEV